MTFLPQTGNRMELKIRIGEGSGVVLLFFLWLVVELELFLASRAIGGIYLLVSFVFYLILVAAQPGPRDKDVALTLQVLPAKNAIRILVPRPIVKEKQYTLGWISLVILKGPVKLTPWRTFIILGILVGSFASFIVWLARTSVQFTMVTMAFVFVGIFILLLVFNFLEVRWRKTDAGR